MPTQLDLIPQWLDTLINRIKPADLQNDIAVKARARIADLLVPAGSLGRLADIAVQVSTIQQTITPSASIKQLLIFAGDHGVTAEGISAYDAAVTANVCRSLADGGGAAAILAKAAKCNVEVIDVGVNSDLSDSKTIVHAKVSNGTGNMAVARASSREETLLAIKAGVEATQRHLKSDVISFGEVGIGNTTASAALFCAFSGIDPQIIVGRGSGVGPATLNKKIEVVQRSLDLHCPYFSDPIEVLSRVGGLEISAMSGAMIAAAAHRIPMVIDGFIASVAAYAAYKVINNSSIFDYMIPSHQSAEKGHRIVLQSLSMSPLVSVDLRIGEGTGALLAMPIIEAACRLMTELHTFTDAGITSPVIPEAIL